MYLNSHLITQLIISGLELGLIYALVAVGFTLIYGTSKIIFCTHGEIYMIGAMLSYYFIGVQGMPFMLTLVIVMLITGLFGVVLERYLFRKLYGNDLGIFLSSLGLAMILSSVFLILFGGQSRGVPSPFSGMFEVHGVMLKKDKLVVSFLSLSLFVGLQLFFTKNKIGQSIRAFTQDKEAAILQGIEAKMTLPICFFVSLALAGGAGVLIAPVYFADVFMGTPALLNTFIVVILGGVGSFPGAILGGIFLGILHTLGSFFIGELSFLLSFVLIIAFLIIRPQGIFGYE